MPAPSDGSDGLEHESDKPKEACGVFGVYAPGQDVARLTFGGLHALQHRGQESAGMAVSDGEMVTVLKEMGLVTNVFTERNLAPLQGHLAIGHTRYSTTGSSTWGNAQPVYRDLGDGGFAIGHNGNLTNTAELAEEAGMFPGMGASDTDVMAELVAQAFSRVDRSDGRELEQAVVDVLPRLRGAFSLVIMDAGHLIAVRDPNGFRPLCLGRLDRGWVVASETPALDIVGAHFMRELEPGEMVVVDAAGHRSLHPFPLESIDPRLCVFEFVYFARPDSVLYGREVHGARQRMGEQLAEQAPLPPDPQSRPAMVMGVPDSGIAAAEGFARASGLPFGQGLVKNRYMGRTFIAPDQRLRAEAVRMKLNPLRENIAGKRLVVVDDSIVRGTTTKAIVRMLREAGAAEVHLRVSSPPYKWPCFYGMDTGRPDELLASQLTVGEIRDFIGADSLAYISLEGLVGAIGATGSGFCDACLTGTYAVPVAIGDRAEVVAKSPKEGHEVLSFEPRGG